MTNKLAGENSPYLLQHANNPVEWYPWGNEALENSRAQDKPIFLSIGYAACHWCHVMAHESFEDPAIADIMNKHFINIKVDREERPDLDSIYMSAVVAMTGSGGWPMSVFLTPDGQPFYGGTYFPPARRYNMPSFQEVLLAIARLWKEDRQQLLQSGEEITNHLRQSQSVSDNEEPPLPDPLSQASLRLAQSYDWKGGGWGQAPKFPQPMAIDFLLRRSIQKDTMALDMAIHALRAMAKGGMFDVIGGGFARYSTDNNWLIPHFEKMLYDNAQLARVYLQAYIITRDESLRRVCEATLDFIIREMMPHIDSAATESGEMFSSLDADSEGEEGKFYLWSLQDLRVVLKSLQDEEKLPDISWDEFFIQAYGVKDTGNFEGLNVLQRAVDDQQLAQQFGLAVDEIPNYLSYLHSLLLSERNKRVRPATDDKILVSWNALALRAFAEAARYLSRMDYLNIARANADFLLTELYQNRCLLRSWRNGEARHSAYLEDYAGLILGLLALYQSDPDAWWFNSALQLAQEMIDNYADPDGGFFDTRLGQEGLLIRPKDLQDNATPSGNALAAMALLQLSEYTGNQQWRSIAETMLRRIQNMAVRYPLAFSEWLVALDFASNPVQQVAIIGEYEHPLTRSFRSQLWSTYRTNTLVAFSDFPPDSVAPSLVQNRVLLDGQPTVYVCNNFVCKLPVNTVEGLIQQIDNAYRNRGETE